MPKLILHTFSDLESINERRLHENFSLSKTERMKKAFQLMAISASLKNDFLKQPQGLGILLKKKK